MIETCKACKQPVVEKRSDDGALISFRCECGLTAAVYLQDGALETGLTHRPHLIYPTHPTWGSIRVVCPGVDVGDCRVYGEGVWPDDVTCRCTRSEGGGCQNCRDAMHELCEQIEGWVDEVGPKCRCEETDRCGVEVWLEDLHPSEVIDEGEWPEEYPWRAAVRWGDGLLLMPWKDEEPTKGTP